jgi:hypothetical protein
VGIDNSPNGLVENAASVEIRKRRGFPPPLGKVAQKAAQLFAHLPQALLFYCFLKGFKKRVVVRNGSLRNFRRED